MDEHVTQDEHTPDVDRPQVVPASPGRGGARLLAAAVTLPWLLGYGITGAWAVTLGARASADGLTAIDAGYTRMVTPGGVIVVGALLLAAFGVLLGAGLMLLFGVRRAASWTAVAVVAGALTAGAVWAAARGGLGPGLWLLFFFGLAYVFVLALVRLASVPRRRGQDSVVSP